MAGTALALYAYMNRHQKTLKRFRQKLDQLFKQGSRDIAQAHKKHQLELMQMLRQIDHGSLQPH